MEQKRKKEIQEEAKRRLNLWLQHSSFNEMSCHGSYIRFNMSIGLAGYPFEEEEWMKGQSFNNFITDEEFETIEYDDIMSELFWLAQTKQDR